MRLKWLYGLLFAIALAIPVSSQISVYIGTPPPVVRYERPLRAPGPGFLWVEGYWEPAGHRYRWAPGHWERPPYEGAHWIHPHYDHYAEGWQFHEGHWDHEDHDNGHWRDHDHDRDDHR
jgi:hypothetical protein